MYDKQIYNDMILALKRKSRNGYLKFIKLKSSLVQHSRFKRQIPLFLITVKYSAATLYDHSSSRID